MKLIWKLSFCVCFLAGDSLSWVNPLGRPSILVHWGVLSNDTLKANCEAKNIRPEYSLMWLQQKGNIITKLKGADMLAPLPLIKTLREDDDGSYIFCRAAHYHIGDTQQLYNIKSHYIPIVFGHKNNITINSNDESKLQDPAPTITVSPLTAGKSHRVGDTVDYVCHADNEPIHTTLEWWQTNPHDNLEYRQSVSYTSEDFVLRKILTLSDNNTYIYCRTMWLANDKYFVRSDYHLLIVSDEDIADTTTATNVAVNHTSIAEIIGEIKMKINETIDSTQKKNNETIDLSQKKNNETIDLSQNKINETVALIEKENTEMKSHLIRLIFNIIGFFVAFILIMLAVLYWMKRKNMLSIKFGRNKKMTQMQSYNEITIPDTVCVLRQDYEDVTVR